MTSKESYDDWHERYGVDHRADTPWHRLVLAHLDPARDVRGKRILEIACGRGGFAAHLARLTSPPPRVLGADFSFAAVSKGKSFSTAAGLRAIEWEVCDAHSLSHPDNSFDTVISCETIEHLRAPRAAVAEFARVLRPGGRLFLTAPNYLGPMGVYRAYARLLGRPYTEEGQPINRFTLLPSTIARVREAGLSVLVTAGRGHYLPARGRAPIEWRALERFGALKWIALHSLTVAEKALPR